MHRLLFFQQWSWPKVAMLCLSWLLLWVVAFAWVMGARTANGPDEFVYAVRIHLNVGTWLLVIGPVALVLLLRWRTIR